MGLRFYDGNGRLGTSIETESIDCVFPSFELKTFSLEQQEALACEINRILKPGGYVSFIEISVPKNKIFRWFYFIYLKVFIPIIGRLFLGNPDCYRMLGMYEMVRDGHQRYRFL